MNVVLPTDTAPVTASDNDLPSPLHRIISRLPSPISIKRVSISSPASSPSNKRQRTSDGSMLSSPDMRRDILVKRFRKKLSNGVKISLVRENRDNVVPELDNSVEILTDTNDNDSLSLEELDAKKSEATMMPECHDDVTNVKDPLDDKVNDVNPVLDEGIKSKYELCGPVNVQSCNDKKVEIQWRSVKRSKRKT